MARQARIHNLGTQGQAIQVLQVDGKIEEISVLPKRSVLVDMDSLGNKTEELKAKRLHIEYLDNPKAEKKAQAQAKAVVVEAPAANI